MVHTRINERTTNPNPHVNFICALPSPGAAYGASEDFEAKETLRALAAQLKPVMKLHGFTVNSFEEYETNKVFLGRNWNNGETIELVLRDGNGQFYPASRLLGVFCHELAHIKHMNHSAAFHALRRQLSSEVAALQRQGYYGDGYWSAGTRLADSERISGKGMGAQELPEYTCGGAHSQSRSSALPSRRRRRARRPAGPSLSTGAQSAKQRKAGSRVTSKTAFEAAGEGSVLDERVEKGGEGSGFRKKAASRRAREERALAAERRLMILQGKLQEPPKKEDSKEDSETESESDDESPHVAETDGDRLKRMHDVLEEEDLAAMRDDDDDDIVILSGPSKTHTNLQARGKGEGKHRLTEDNIQDVAPIKKLKKGVVMSPQDLEESSDGPSWPASSSAAGQSSLTGGILQEIRQRKREALGMDRPRTLGSGVSASQTKEGEWACKICTFVNNSSNNYETCLVCEQPRQHAGHKSETEWPCSVCTFENAAMDAKCAMCNHPKG